MKATYKEVKHLIDNTDWTNGAFTKDEQPSISELGYFTPQGANWAYRLGVARSKNDGNIYEVVTVFGEVKGYRLLLWKDEA